MRGIQAGSILLTCAGYVFARDTLHLTLPEAERLALQNNPRIQVSRLNAAASHEVINEERANLQPTLFGSVTGVGADPGSRLAAGNLNNPIIYERLGSGLTLSQLITDFGRTSNLTESAKLRAEAQDQSTEDARAQILLGTDRAYFALLRANAILKVAQETVSARQLVADQVTALAKSNLKSALDVSFANVNLGEAKLMLASAQNAVKAAEADLASAMGLPGQKSGFVVEEAPTPEALPDRVDPLIADAMRQRPDLESARLEQSAAARFTVAERDLQFPSIGVVGSAGFVPAGNAAIPGKYGAIGVNVNIPIFNGGLFRARRNEAELRAQAAAQSVSDLQNRIARDVRVAYLNAQTAFERLTLTSQVLDQARLALDLAQRRYNLGLSSIVELSQAQLNLTSAEIASATARYDYQAQRSNLAFQIGVLR